ncbi:MAG: electron transport complex subunit E [Gammaproteobacteria bacterium]
MSDYRTIIKEGIWSNNAGLVQLLGLCPLLAVTNSFINGLGLGLATTATLVLTGGLVSLIRSQLRDEIRIPVFVLIIASVVTAIELSMNAYFHDLYKILGIFIPLIVTNCAIIGRAEAFASKNSFLKSVVDGLSMGIGFTLVLVVLGAMREIIGKGTLFSQAHLMFGEQARSMTIMFSEDYPGFLLAVLPPGAFIGLGILIALKNIVDNRAVAKKKSIPVSVTPAAAQVTQ